MGTSNSYGGPSDSGQLLPDWAQPDTDTDSSAPESDKPENDKPESGQTSDSLDPPDQITPISHSYWRTAKTRMSRFVSGNSDLRQAGNAYVSAKGGVRRAAQSASVARISTQRIASLLTSISSSGLDSTLQNFGLEQLVGKDIDAVFAGIVDVIASNSDGFENSIVRQAMDEALGDLYERCVEDDNLYILDELSESQIKDAVEKFITGYIYNQWLLELGKSLEIGTVSEPEAIRLENEIKEYVRDAVKLDLENKNILDIDWDSKEGRDIIQRIYLEAFAVIGGA